MLVTFLSSKIYDFLRILYRKLHFQKSKKKKLPIIDIFRFHIDLFYQFLEREIFFELTMIGPNLELCERQFLLALWSEI